MTTTKTKVQHQGRVTKKVARSTVTLAMMAHGEPLEMFETIRERVGTRISDWCAVVDTDDTETARNIEKAFAGIPGEVHMLPWIDDKYGTGHGDYAANRNRMLALAREADSDYVMWLDPDDPLEGTIPDHLDEDVYLFEIKVEGTTWYMHHMFKRGVECKWQQPIHEHLEFASGTKTPKMLDTCWLSRNGSGSYRTDRIEQKAIPLLLKMVEENPEDGHAWYYLAQSYRDSGHKPEAAAAFNQRAEMGGEPQAVFWCRFQVAEMTGSPDDYLIAWDTRPTRVEPLHRLAAYYNARGQWVVGRMFAQLALGIYPSTDGMFVERWVEVYGCLAEFAFSSYYLGKSYNDPTLVEKAQKAWEYILAETDPEILQPAHKVLFESNLEEIKNPGSGAMVSTYERAILESGLPIVLSEGSISEQEAHFLGTLVAGWTEDRPMRVAQTGFGVGKSAWAFLENNPLCTVTSFDMMETENGHHADQHEPITNAASVIDKHFPGRHQLIEGDSKVTVPAHMAEGHEYDLVFVDGGHDYETAIADLKNFARPGCIVVLDDTVVGPLWAEGVVRAWKEATDKETGFIHHRLESRDGPHVWSLGEYSEMA